MTLAILELSDLCKAACGDGDIAVFYDATGDLGWTILAATEPRALELGLSMSEGGGRYQASGETFEVALAEVRREIIKSMPTAD